MNLSSLRQKQSAQFKSLIKSTQPPSTSFKKNPNNPYSILICDKHANRVIGPLFTSDQLLELGIVSIFRIDADRTPLPSYTAIYFVTPTLENVEIIQKDLSEQLYLSAKIHFLTPTDDATLSHFSHLIASHGLQPKILQVTNQHLSFISYDRNLFTLNMKDSALNLYSPSLDQTGRHEYLQSVATSLMDVIATLGQKPVICYPDGEITSEFGLMMNTLIQNDPILHTNTVSPSIPPLLLIFDRSLDYSSAIAHPWSYFGLINEILQLRPGRVSYTPNEDGGSKRDIDLNLDSDFFWNKHYCEDFDKIAEKIGNLVNDYRSERKIIGSKLGGTDDANAEKESESKVIEMDVSALNHVTPLANLKDLVDNHTGIAKEVSRIVVQRSIDTLSVLESQMIHQHTFDSEEIATLINKISSETSDEDESRNWSKWEDIVRLVCIGLLNCGGLSEFDSIINDIENATNEFWTPIFNHVRRHARLQQVQRVRPSPKSNDGKRFFSTLRLRKEASEPTKSPLIDLFQNVTSGLQPTQCTPIFYNTLTNEPLNDGTGLIFKDVIVFVLGGGTSEDYTSLSLAANRLEKSIVFGCPELLTIYLLSYEMKLYDLSEQLSVNPANPVLIISQTLMPFINIFSAVLMLLDHPNPVENTTFHDKQSYSSEQKTLALSERCGIDHLSKLYTNSLHVVDLTLSNVAKVLFHPALRIFLHHLLTWCMYGSLETPQSDFFIYDTHLLDSPSQQYEVLSFIHDERQRFSIQTSSIPNFFPTQLTEIVLDCGILVRVILMTQNIAPIELSVATDDWNFETQFQRLGLNSEISLSLKQSLSSYLEKQIRSSHFSLIPLTDILNSLHAALSQHCSYLLLSRQHLSIALTDYTAALSSVALFSQSDIVAILVRAVGNQLKFLTPSQMSISKAWRQTLNEYTLLNETVCCVSTLVCPATAVPRDGPFASIARRTPQFIPLLVQSAVSVLSRLLEPLNALLHSTLLLQYISSHNRQSSQIDLDCEHKAEACLTIRRSKERTNSDQRSRIDASRTISTSQPN
ncbi:putative SEC1 family transport protein SLY1 [Blattamonas nauphoetae]|uniref:SEC1 family transport protein SLY1 n=1 Tax=Blattamonas nauphoetae TaxID=2049346 RepID=A0ABQ9Y1R7_9EUKA|nr:putative SEC1 family transport protein SLY1 [Blattamonas nauphoetae]